MLPAHCRRGHNRLCMAVADGSEQLIMKSDHCWSLAQAFPQATEVLYLEPEFALVPEALRALQKGMVLLGGSNGDVGVGALVGKGAHTPLAAIAVCQGCSSTACQPAPSISFRAIALQHRVPELSPNDKDNISCRWMSGWPGTTGAGMTAVLHAYAHNS